MHGVELYIVITFVVSVLRSLYNFLTGLTVIDWIERARRLRKIAADKPPPGMLSGTFRIRFDYNWQFVATLIALGPYAFFAALNLAYWAQQRYNLTNTFQAFEGLGLSGFNVYAHTPLSIIYLMTQYLDLKDIWKV